jgi:hypothetical protein
MKDKNKSKRGRKTLICTEELADEICLKVANGKTLLNICKEPGMPSRCIIHKWLLDPSKKYFIDKYRIAKDLQTDYLFDECLEIADDASGDFVEKKVNGVKVEAVDHEHIARSRLKVDTRKWYIAKVAPKKYGDLLDRGGEGLNVVINICRANKD